MREVESEHFRGVVSWSNSELGDSCVSISHGRCLNHTVGAEEFAVPCDEVLVEGSEVGENVFESLVGWVKAWDDLGDFGHDC